VVAGRGGRAARGEASEPRAGWGVVEEGGELPSGGAPAGAYPGGFLGEDALVPPTSSQVPPVPKVSYTATPVLGSATAETSLLARRAHWVATPACQDGLASTAEQPEPVPLQTASAQPPLVAPLVSQAPPT